MPVKRQLWSAESGLIVFVLAALQRTLEKLKSVVFLSPDSSLHMNLHDVLFESANNQWQLVTLNHAFTEHLQYQFRDAGYNDSLFTLPTHKSLKPGMLLCWNFCIFRHHYKYHDGVIFEGIWKVVIEQCYLDYSCKPSGIVISTESMERKQCLIDVPIPRLSKNAFIWKTKCAIAFDVYTDGRS